MIEINDLNFQYKKRKPLFAGLSLTMKQGRITGLLGKNGAGKSTLLKLIAGLLQPQQGQLLVGGYQPNQRDPNYLSDIYMIPEEFYLPSISIAAYVKAISPLYPHFDNGKLENILKEFELQAGDNLNKLSHGQRKKFLIAFALATNCRLLILDEPTNGLDIPSKSLFRKILVGSVGDEQLVLISTHQVKDIDVVIDTVVMVDNGKLLFQDSMENVSRNYLFETVQELDKIPDLVYQEKAPLGYRIVRRNNGADETEPDLELFFNAIIHQSIS
jgi:ABC-2 type transport system ATP-binding protein